MPDSDPNLDDIQDDDSQGLRGYAKREAKRAADAETELADLRKKDAFRDAGLDPTNKQHAAIIRGYDGELDQVKGWVTDLGLTAANTPPADPPPIPTDEQEALNRVAGMPSGDGGTPLDPDADGNARLKAIRDKAVNEKWGPQRFNDEFTAEMIRQRRPVANLDVVN